MENVFKKIRTIEESREMSRLSASEDSSPQAASHQQLKESLNCSGVSAAVSAGSAESAEETSTGP